jgi:hypothetical protein
MSMFYLSNLFRSRPWHKLTPALSGVITGGAGSGTTLAVAGYASDSSSIMAYLPSQRSITINPARLRGDSIHVYWYNPSDGAVTDAGMFSKVSRSYNQPSSGDWVMVMDGKGFHFNPPGTLASVLASPPNSATGQSLSPLLAWYSNFEADTYSLCVALDAGFNSIVRFDSLQTDTTSQLTGLNSNTTYYWRVRWRNLQGESQWSEVWSFTTTGQAPLAPTLVAPADGSSNLPTITQLRWSSDPIAETHHVQLSVDPGFSSVVFQDSLVSDTTRQITGLSTAAQYYWRVRSRNSLGQSPWSSVWSFATAFGQSVLLPGGWNMVSSYVAPVDSTLSVLFGQVNPHLLLMKNGRGGVYWPEFGINTIGMWNYRDGYQLYMQTGDTLSVVGDPLEAQSVPIGLVQNWNLVGYVRSSPMRVDSAVVSLRSDTLLIVKNNAGQVYWPAYNINTIGSMVPGEGYQVYVSRPAILTYPVVSGRPEGSMVSSASEAVPAYYVSAIGNTGVNALLLVELVQEGDEVGAWTSEGVLVGGGVAHGGRALLTIWGANALSHQEETGASEGGALSLTVWSKAERMERPLIIRSLRDGLTGKTKDNLTLRYSTNAVLIVRGSVGQELPTMFDLSQNYPNPFNPATMIRYQLPVATRVVLKVFDVLGRLVRTLVDEEREAGTYSVGFNGGDLASGVYMYRMETTKGMLQRKLLLVK